MLTLIIFIMKFKNDLLNKMASINLPEKDEKTNLDNIRHVNIPSMKSGGKIHIKKANRGKFTEYCGGKVTAECIARGKRSPNPTIRKRATFAANSRKWNKK